LRAATKRFSGTPELPRGITLATAAGVSDHVWKMEAIVASWRRGRLDALSPPGL
jgi:hypothetical protein